MAQPPLIDLASVPDVFCSGIARVERIAGGCVRLVIYVEKPNERMEWMVVARLIWPVSALRGLRREITKIHDGK